MTTFRLLSLPAHGAIELLAGLALIAAPFVLGFAPAGMVLAVAFGVLLVGLALSTDGALPVSAHLAFDESLVIGCAAGAVALAVSRQDVAAAGLAAVAAIELALTLTTRYSRSRVR